MTTPDELERGATWIALHAPPEALAWIRSATSVARPHELEAAHRLALAVATDCPRPIPTAINAALDGYLEARRKESKP